MRVNEMPGRNITGVASLDQIPAFSGRQGKQEDFCVVPPVAIVATRNRYQHVMSPRQEMGTVGLLTSVYVNNLFGGAAVSQNTHHTLMRLSEIDCVARPL